MVTPKCLYALCCIIGGVACVSRFAGFRFVCTPCHTPRIETNIKSLLFYTSVAFLGPLPLSIHLGPGTTVRVLALFTRANHSPTLDRGGTKLACPWASTRCVAVGRRVSWGKRFFFFLLSVLLFFVLVASLPLQLKTVEMWELHFASAASGSI